jgi:hypothetical protein
VFILFFIAQSGATLHYLIMLPHWTMSGLDRHFKLISLHHYVSVKKCFVFILFLLHNQVLLLNREKHFVVVSKFASLKYGHQAIIANKFCFPWKQFAFVTPRLKKLASILGDAEFITFRLNTPSNIQEKRTVYKELLIFEQELTITSLPSALRIDYCADHQIDLHRPLATFSSHSLIHVFFLAYSEVRVEGLETLDYLDNLQSKKRFTEQEDVVVFESEVSLCSAESHGLTPFLYPINETLTTFMSLF